MSESPHLTEALIRAASTAQSFERGEEYYHSGAIYNTARLGNVLFGECEGTTAPSYRVQAELDEAGIQSAECTCPYDWGGYCKHIVALLLTYIDKPDAFVARQEPTELLADMSRDDLVVLIGKLLQQHPDLYDWLAAAAQKPKSEARHARKTPVSAEAYRRQVSTILHSLDRMSSSEAYWGVSGMVEQLGEVQDSAQKFLESGDAEGALTILTTLLKEVASQVDSFDDSDGTLGEFVSGLGQPIAEAILSAELSEAERKQVADKLTELAGELVDYGMDEGLDVAIAAAMRGWSDAEAEEEFAATDLTEARLNVLDRQGKTDAYLALCQQAGRHLRYALKLLDLGRVEESIAVAMAHFATADESLALAQRLRDAGHIQNALAVGERGLMLAGRKNPLGQWLGPIEEAQGRVEQALSAHLAAFAEMPSLNGYTTIRRLAGSGWDDLKPKAMEMLRASPNTDALVDVSLAEEDWDAAIQIADKSGWNYRLIEKVADAVIAHRPEWVIKTCRREAEQLIGKGQSKYYATAARWLAKVKAAYVRQGREDDWRAYLDRLRAEYARRPALQAELRRL